jgi:hypothetical protein
VLSKLSLELDELGKARIDHVVRSKTATVVFPSNYIGRLLIIEGYNE